MSKAPSFKPEVLSSLSLPVSPEFVTVVLVERGAVYRTSLDLHREREGFAPREREREREREICASLDHSVDHSTMFRY